MKTRAEIEAALDVLGWKIIDGPRLTSEGWRGTIERGSLLMTTFAPRGAGARRPPQARAGVRRCARERGLVMSPPGNPDRDEDTLRSFLARILGWSDEHRAAIEHALRSIDLGVTRRAALVLLGATVDAVPITEALHRRTLGTARPFVLQARRPGDHESAAAAVQAARGGSLCLIRDELPRDFSSMVPMVRDPAADVQLIVCGNATHVDHPFLIVPVPINVPSLAARAGDLPQIVDGFARDAIATLGAFERDFTDADRGWVVEHAANTWDELERATMRIVALRNSSTITEAAERLGMVPATLRRWIHNRKLTPRGEARP